MYSKQNIRLLENYLKVKLFTTEEKNVELLMSIFLKKFVI